MDIKDMTMEQLRTENPALYDSIAKGGSEAERQRMQEIDDLTPAGYESMAATAKKEGTSAIEYHKQVVKAQRDKAASFMSNRKDETAPSAQVPGGASDDDAQSVEAKIAMHAKELADYAKKYHASTDGGMF